jgi:hypothetical protein
VRAVLAEAALASNTVRSAELPEDIRAITTKNAMPLRHESFDDDTENIIAAVLGLSAKKRTWEHKSSLWTKIIYAFGGLIAASGFTVIAALIHFWMFARPLSSSIGVPGTQILLIAVLAFGIWFGLQYESRKQRMSRHTD